MISRRVTGVVLLALAATGCASQQFQAAKAAAQENAKFDDFGRAVRQNIAAQIADPDAVYRTPRPPTDGKRMDLVQRRYQIDQPPTSQVRTSNLGGNESQTAGAAAPTANEAATASPNP